MALQVKVGRFTDDGIVSQNVTGVGFQPKALIILSVHTATDDGFIANGRISVGMATRQGGATQQRCIGISHTDNVDPSVAGKVWDNTLTPTLDFGGLGFSLTSFLSDGFSITKAGVGSSDYEYYAIGGADLTDAVVVEDDWPTTGATFDVVGAGFTPDCAIYLTGVGTALAEDTTEANANMGLGVFAGAEQWAIALTTTDGDSMTSTMNNNSVFSADSCLTLIGENADTVDAKGIFSAFTSDGATITNTNAPTAALRVFALYLQGGQYKAGSKAKAATASADSFTFSTPTFTPVGVLLGQAVGTVSNTVVAAEAEITIGGASAVDGSAEAYAGATIGELDPAAADSIQSGTKAIAELTPGTTPAVDAAGDMTAFGSGSFELTWDAAGTAALVGFLAMGNAAPPGQPYRKRLGGVEYASATQHGSVRVW